MPDVLNQLQILLFTLPFLAFPGYSYRIGNISSIIWKEESSQLFIPNIRNVYHCYGNNKTEE